MRGGGEKEKAHHPVDAAHALEVILDQVAETDLIVKVLLPALDAAVDTNRHVTLLTNNTAVTAGFVSGGQVS
jgi:hypothetical protein